MKKSLFMFGVVVVLSFLMCNVYGATTYVDTIDDLYTLADTDRVSLASNTWSVMWSGVNFDYTDLINSDVFQNKLKSYSYYTIYANYTGSKTIYVLFSKEIPTLTLYRDDSYVYSFRFDNILNYTYTYFDTTSEIDYDVSKISSSTWYSSSCSGSLMRLFTNSKIAYRYTLKDDFINNICTNYDLKYTSSSTNVIPNKNPEFSFIPTYSENYESCNLKLDIINEPDYYTLQYAINSSSSEWYEFDNSVGVTVENNCLVIVRMLDENADELFASSYNVAILEDMLSSTYFRVNFDNSQKYILSFTPILYNNASDSFDIYFSYNSVATDEINSGEVAFQNTNNAFTIWDNYSNSVEDFICGNGSTYYLRPNGGAEITLTFKIVNKYSGVTALTRTFKFNLSYDYAEALESTTNGTKDGIFNSGAGSSLENNLLTSEKLEIDWSTENATETAKSFFNNAIEFLNVIVAFLSVLPAWITVPLYIFFILLIILFVIKFIRG